jgi:hypothetical protein
MRLSVAKAQIEREHPELDGSAKLAAIKALRETNPDEDQGRLTGIAWVVIALDWWTAIGTVIAIVGLFAELPDTVGPFWPAKIQPGWLSIALGLVGFFVLTALYGILEEHGKTRKPVTKPV